MGGWGCILSRQVELRLIVSGQGLADVELAVDERDQLKRGKVKPIYISISITFWLACLHWYGASLPALSIHAQSSL